jgi:hypothetical protein
LGAVPRSSGRDRFQALRHSSLRDHQLAPKSAQAKVCISLPLIFSALIFGSVGSASTQVYPTRAITVVAAGPAGGPTARCPLLTHRVITLCETLCEAAIAPQFVNCRNFPVIAGVITTYRLEVKAGYRARMVAPLGRPSRNIGTPRPVRKPPSLCASCIVNSGSFCTSGI